MVLQHNPPGSAFWDALFSPDSVAVIGANDTLGAWGADAMKAAIDFAAASSGRRAYAVNPNQKQVMGILSYPSILDVPDKVDLAIIVVRAGLVPEVMRQCAAKAVKAAVVISAGFAETDEDGIRLEREVVAIARAGGIRFVGPNCIGHADLYTRVGALGVAGRGVLGPLALLAQSGTVSSSIMQTASMMGIGLSKFVSTGNEADLHLEDYLEYLSGDSRTRVIAAYVEGLREGRRFFELAKRTTAEKPIVVLKVGGTEGASKAARSHTGALAGSDAVHSAAFRQAGVIRADDEEELCDVVLGLLTLPLPRSNRVGILTMGGGFGVITAEACEREGLNIAPLQPETIARLDRVLPARWSHGNPVDMVGVKDLSEFQTSLACLESMLQDDNIDSIIALVANRGYAGEKFREVMMENERGLNDVGERARRLGKPLLLVRRFSAPAPSLMNGSFVSCEGRLPEYPRPQRAARALAHLVRYARHVRSRKIG